jgi:hypothetical protein
MAKCRHVEEGMMNCRLPPLVEMGGKGGNKDWIGMDRR